MNAREKKLKRRNLIIISTIHDLLLQSEQENNL